MKARAAAAIVGLLALISFAGWLLAAPEEKLGPRNPADRPGLALLTSLPIVFGESFSLDRIGSPAMTRLEQRYDVALIDVADSASLKGRKLLLMAHPRAQPAEALVELDRWVQEGGAVLLLADPRLDWPSERPLGDRLRPPPGFADTGLLAHWGIRLEGPITEGPAVRGEGDRAILTASPGKLQSSRCQLLDDGLIARCRVGRGKVTVMADADFLHVQGEGSLDGPTENNLELLLGELELLESRQVRESRAKSTYLSTALSR